MAQKIVDQLSEQRASLLEMSRKILRLAEAQAWDELEHVEAERRALIEEHFSISCPAAEAQASADTIREILSLDAHTLTLVERGRNRTVDDLRSMNQGKRAHAAYTANKS